MTPITKATLYPTPEGGLYSLHDPGEPTTTKPRISIAPEEESLLAALAFQKSVLEIGTGLGISTTAMASTANYVCTLDVDPWVMDNIWPGLRNRNINPGSHRLIYENRFHLAFIDGSHKPSDFLDDLTYCMEAVMAGGLVVAHDAKELRETIEATPMHWWYLDTTYGLALTVAS